MHPNPIASGAVRRDEEFNYNTGYGRNEDGSWRYGITDTSAPRPEPFTWGRVLRVHVVGDDYAIVEYAPRKPINVRAKDFDPSPRFSVFVRGARGHSWDCGRGTTSLDRALLHAITWRAEQRHGGRRKAENSQAVSYVAQMLGLDR